MLGIILAWVAGANSCTPPHDSCELQLGAGVQKTTAFFMRSLSITNPGQPTQAEQLPGFPLS